MFKKIKRAIKAIKNYDNIVRLLLNQSARGDVLEKENLELKNKVGDPIEVVKNLTESKFIFFDYWNLDRDTLTKYHNQAVSILKSEVLKNEIAKLNSEFAIWASKESRDFKGVEAMRHQISGINLLIERLMQVPNPEKDKPPATEPYKGI